MVSVDEIQANDYDLSINKYKEVEREKEATNLSATSFLV